MVSVTRILRDYEDAGSVNRLLALWGFVDDTTFLTKAGHVGVVYWVRGVDYEGLSHPQRRALAHRFEGALRLLDEHCRVYQYLLKRTVRPFVAAACQPPIANEAIQRRAVYLNGRRDDLYDLSLYLVLLYEAPHVARRSTELRQIWQDPRKALRAWLSPDHALQLVETELDRAIGTLHHKAQAFEVQIESSGRTGWRRPMSTVAVAFLMIFEQFAFRYVTTKSSEWQTELETIRGETAKHEQASHDYAVTGSKILELAKSAHNLFIRQNSQDQARLLKTLLRTARSIAEVF